MNDITLNMHVTFFFGRFDKKNDKNQLSKHKIY